MDDAVYNFFLESVLLNSMDLSSLFRSNTVYDEALEIAFNRLKNKRSYKFIKQLNDLGFSRNSNLSCQDGIVFSEFKDRINYDDLKNIAVDLKPWRKGPFQLGRLGIDSEWQCQLKWERLASKLVISNKQILDIGCGNGYYLYRCIEQGARFVLGLDPHLLYLYQYSLVNMAMPSLPIAMLPLGWQDCDSLKSVFDYIFCLGVLYHQKQPLELLTLLKNRIQDQGNVVLETLILAGDGNDVLEPEDRYACMKNVFYIPTLSVLRQWFKSAGFLTFDVLDVTKTTPAEQRSSDWSSDYSLINFLHPSEHYKTIEGYPAPIRAIVIAS